MLLLEPFSLDFTRLQTQKHKTHTPDLPEPSACPCKDDSDTPVQTEPRPQSILIQTETVNTKIHTFTKIVHSEMKMLKSFKHF